MSLLERRPRLGAGVPSEDEAPDWRTAWTVAIPVLLIVFQFLPVA